MGKGLVVVALAWVVAGGGPDFAAAAETSSGEQALAERPEQGCEAFAWPIVREQAWFNDARLARRNSGARLSRIDRAVELALVPMNKARFFMAPERPVSAEGYSGETVFFGVPRPAIYQVTVSEDVSIDVFENGVRLKPISSTGAPDCAGVRRSARYRLAPGDLVLIELSGAEKASIKLAFVEAP
jgi:hypothetical protein